MKRTLVITTRIIFIYSILLLFGFFKSPPSLTFGYGLGDIGILIIDGLIFCTYFLSFLWIKNKQFSSNQGYWVFIAIGLLLVGITILQLTIFRGGEYPLDRGFFICLIQVNKK